MNKDAYFEMCEALGNEPIEEEIPVDMDDFPEAIQQAFTIYFMLKDCWDSMGGSYLGKDMSNLFQFFDLHDIATPDRLYTLNMIQHMDFIRSTIVSEKLDASRKPSSKKA